MVAGVVVCVWLLCLWGVVVVCAVGRLGGWVVGREWVVAVVVVCVMWNVVWVVWGGRVAVVAVAVVVCGCVVWAWWCGDCIWGMRWWL